MIPSLRVRHRPMSFLACIGVLMGNNGLIPWLECAFTGVANMLTGKKFPINICALTFMV